MATYKGLIYVKHGRVGTRSEGPDYILQTASGEYPLRYGERHLWEPDYRLEFYVRRMVEIEGELETSNTLQVKHIREILSPLIPREEKAG